jgi:hypothetical protein
MSGQIFCSQQIIYFFYKDINYEDECYDFQEVNKVFFVFLASYSLKEMPTQMCFDNIIFRFPVCPYCINQIMNLSHSINILKVFLYW